MKMMCVYKLVFVTTKSHRRDGSLSNYVESDGILAKSIT